MNKSGLKSVTNPCTRNYSGLTNLCILILYQNKYPEYVKKTDYSNIFEWNKSKFQKKKLVRSINSNFCYDRSVLTGSN